MRTGRHPRYRPARAGSRGCSRAWGVRARGNRGKSGGGERSEPPARRAPRLTRVRGGPPRSTSISDLPAGRGPPVGPRRHGKQAALGASAAARAWHTPRCRRPRSGRACPVGGGRRPRTDAGGRGSRRWGLGAARPQNPERGAGARARADPPLRHPTVRPARPGPEREPERCGAASAPPDGAAPSLARRLRRLSAGARAGALPAGGGRRSRPRDLLPRLPRKLGAAGRAGGGPRLRKGMFERGGARRPPPAAPAPPAHGRRRRARAAIKGRRALRPEARAMPRRAAR